MEGTQSHSPSGGSRFTRALRAVLGTLPLGLLVFVVLGLGALFPGFADPWLLVALVAPLVLTGVLRALLHGPDWLLVVGIVVGAVAVPVLALVGVDWLVARFSSEHPDAAVSLIAGAAIVGAAAWVYLRPWWVRETIKPVLLWTAALVVVLVVLPPVGVFLWGEFQGDERELAPSGPAVSRLDVIVLRPGAAGSATAADQTERAGGAAGWKVSTWEGEVDGDRLRWGETGRPDRVPRTDADRVLLLMVDGDAEQPHGEDGEISRWLELADRVTPLSTPTSALLRHPDQARLASWNAALGPGQPRDARHGRALSLEALAGSPTTTDLAFRLAVNAPTSDEDLTLAAKYRPALFLDDKERYPTPLNIDRLLESGKLRLCDKGQALRRLCQEVDGSEDLHNGGAYLAFDDPDELAAIKRDSTIYVHVTRSGNDHRNAVYLDYWWYFPHNPAGAGGGALCGAGFVIAGYTCFDHQSDWEGITVVLDSDLPASPTPAPTGVSYAQHEGVTRYTWAALQRLWDRGDRERFGDGVGDNRPLVFIAQGTHASYPTSCGRPHCAKPDVPGVRSTRPFTENRHNGAERWPGANERARCPSFCVTALPTRNSGLTRARWNAFDGHWGDSNCVMGVIFCSSSDPPLSPGEQDRYEKPWCAVETVSVADRVFKLVKQRRCAAREPSGDELGGGERLLALGDSFSSGQGAGSYDPDTTGRANTCYRSPGSWAPATRAQAEAGLPGASRL